jgi:magnesium-transporting ATPase (P-type)
VYFGGITIIITVVMGILSILQTKSRLNGLITFKEAFSSYFYTLLIGTIIGTLYLIILFKLFFNPEKITFIKQTLIDFNVHIMKLNNASPSDISKSVALSEKFDPSNAIEIITSSLKYLLRDCLIGFIVALIFRNKRTFSS